MAMFAEPQRSVSEAVSSNKNNQSKLEEEMVSLGRDRYHHKLKRAKETSLESTTAVGQHLLAESIELMGDALKSWLKSSKSAPGRRHRAYPLLKELPPKVVAGLTARCILDCISIERKITSTAITIGRLLEDELKFRKVKAEEPALWNQICRVLDRHKSQKTKSKFINKTMKFHDLVVPSWSREEAASVGLTCIELLRQSTGIIETVTRRDQQGRSYTIVRPTDELMNWMKNAHEYRESLNPVWLPTVEKPIDWNNPYIGGYQALSYRRRPLVKTLDREFMEQLGLYEMPSVYSAINHVQRVSYAVDQNALETLKHCWDKGYPIDGLPSLIDEPVPNKPSDISTNKESRRQYRKRAARIHFENERQKSKRIQVMKVINLSDKFPHDDLFFVRQMDFRARGYPVPYFLQIQGPSYVQSLLKFSRGKPLTDSGTMWLYIYAASKWGLDKSSYTDRLKWTEENIKFIRRIGDSPIENKDWADADDPWLFKEACVEIAKMHDQGASFSSTLPITLDATNQGLQIYIMMLKDAVGAPSVNVLDGESPQSIYKNVAKAVYEKLVQSDNPYADAWISFCKGKDNDPIPSLVKAAKRPTMTLVYGSTFFSCRGYTADWFYGLLKSGRINPFGEETYRPCNFLATLIWESIDQEVRAAKIGMDWLRQSAQLFVDHKVTPQWITPLGFPVKMYYENTNKYAVKTLVGGVLRQHRIRTPNGTTNKRKTVNAICANFIHSLDGFGGLLGKIVNLASECGVRDIKDQHDSIGVHASDVDVMQSCIRQATVELFNENQLENLANQLEPQLPSGVSLPTLPALGNLNIEDVLRSKYYFNV